MEGKNDRSLNNGFNAAKLALIAGAFSTLSEGLDTIAAALAIEEESIASEKDSKELKNELRNLQRQIDSLTKEVRQLRKSLGRWNYLWYSHQISILILKTLQWYHPSFTLTSSAQVT